MSKQGCGPTDAELTAYLEGEVTPSDCARIEKGLQESSSARQRLSTLRQIREALVRPVGELEPIDLVSGLHRAIEADRVRLKRTLRINIYHWMAAAASVALVVGAAGRVRGGKSEVSLQHRAVSTTTQAAAPSSPNESEFRAKGAGNASEPSRWAGVQLYRLQQHGRPERVFETVRNSDGLLFSYTNLGREPFEYLMIFAVASNGTIKWFYPAYAREGENPTSIAIQKGEATVPLPELIHHEFVAGELNVHALFSHRPLSVQAVERLVSEQHLRRDGLALEDTLDQVHTVRVGP